MSTAARDPESRTAHVAGPATRVEALADAALDARTLDLIGRLQRLNGLPPQTEVHPFYGTLARSPRLFAAFLDMGTELSTGAALAPRDRELAILRVAWLCGGPYVWGEHVAIGRRHGLDADEIERVIAGSHADGWTPCERALLRAVEELHADAMIADGTWATLAEHYDARQLVELPMLVGHYHLTIFVQNALRIGLSPRNPGLAAR